MKITRRENFLLRRALDKASSPAEADMAAKALIASLRARGVSGYDIVPADGAKPAAGQPEASTAPPGPPFTEPWQSAAAREAQAAQAQAWQNYYQSQAANMSSEQQAAWASAQAQAQAQYHAPEPEFEPQPEPEPQPRTHRLAWLLAALGWLLFGLFWLLELYWQKIL